MAIADEIKRSFKLGSTLTKLIYLNIGVFILVKLIEVITLLFLPDNMTGLILPYLATPASLSQLLARPWTLVTYMFLHEDFLHILFNMLWLFWFGRLFLEYLDQGKLLIVYVLGGLSGAFLYILTFNLFPVFEPVLGISIALGASASVLAIVVAIAAHAPNHRIHLMFIGPVQIKWVALVTFLLTSLIDFSINTGGKIAHIGGAAFGYFYALQLRSGRNPGQWVLRTINTIGSWFKPRKKIRVTHKKPRTDFEYNKMKAEERKNLDEILDKISKAGYDSLTKKEKEILFRAGKDR